MAKWRRHSVEYKREVVERMKASENITALARELGIERKLLYTWKYQFEGRPEPRHAKLGDTAEGRLHRQYQTEIARLKQALADKTLEVDFFESALHRIEEARQRKGEPGGTACSRKSGRGRQCKAD